MPSTLPSALQEQKDEEMISAAFQHLLDTYIAGPHRKHTEIITKAFHFAKQAHKGVRRRSGEPYIMHPLAVAQIACEEIGLGSTSICAALLHDVEEDTDYTHEDIENLFGPRIANIVEGVTKISGGIFGDRASAQAETFKKLLLTMSDDIRVILIKISDRLHNMRTLSSMLPSKQYKIAGETLYLFAPIAERLGLNRIKTELENLSFKYEHPKEYAEICKKIEDTAGERAKFLEEFKPPIVEQLDTLGIPYVIKERIKSPYSIWSKMQRKNITFEEVFDLLAIRIIFTPKNRDEERDECFKIYSRICDIYKSHPQRLRNWVSNPKANGYQALHDTFMSHSGHWVEVQIRSDRMDDIAEAGFAAHWKYKEATDEYDEEGLNHLLASIREILDDPQPDSIDLLDNIKLNLFNAEIMVFTPKGEMKKMPAGATVLDFAFTIHSFLGSHCFGAKVNHKLEPLSYQLKSGDQVEILTSQNTRVAPEWLDYASTAKARGKIQALLRRAKRESQARGEAAVREWLEAHDFPAQPVHIDRLARLHALPSREELYSQVADGSITLGDDDVQHLQGRARSKGWRRFVPFLKTKEAEATQPQADCDTAEFVQNLNRKETLVLTPDVLRHCRISPCCRPIPGDSVMGYIAKDGVIEIHKRRCDVALKLKSNYGNDILACTWGEHYDQLFDASIYIKGVDNEGVLYSIADVLHRQQHHVVRRITLSTRDGIFEGTMDVRVHDTADLSDLCQSLAKIECVTRAVRTN